MKILLNPLISCLTLFSQPITTDIIQEYKECKQIEFQVESVSVWLPLIEKYFRQEDHVEVSRIIFCESSGRSRAENVNSNATKTLILFALFMLYPLIPLRINIIKNPTPALIKPPYNPTKKNSKVERYCLLLDNMSSLTFRLFL